jgi:hypothetical protein
LLRPATPSYPPAMTIWRPGRERVAQANLTQFMQVLAHRGVAVSDYSALHVWSVAEPGAFWSELARFAQVRADWGSGPVLTDAALMPGARFFPGAQLNFAENLLRYRDDQPALIFRNERGQRAQLTFNELHVAVARVAAWLESQGVGRGDRVAAVLPNIPEACVAMLATATRGAIWSSCSPELGTNALLERFGQIAPKVLFCADGYTYAGKRFENLPALAELIAHLPSIERVAVVGYLHPLARSQASNGPNASRNSGGRLGTSTSSASISTTRCTSSTPPAPPARRSASCTGSAAPCCSTRRSTCCTRTLNAATGCSITRPAAG